MLAGLRLQPVFSTVIASCQPSSKPYIHGVKLANTLCSFYSGKSVNAPFHCCCFWDVKKSVQLVTDTLNTKCAWNLEPHNFSDHQFLIKVCSRSNCWRYCALKRNRRMSALASSQKNLPLAKHIIIHSITTRQPQTKLNLQQLGVWHWPLSIMVDDDEQRRN